VQTSWLIEPVENAVGSGRQVYPLDMSDSDRPTTLQLALRLVNDAALAYSSNPAFRAIVTAIPFVSSLDALAGTQGSNIALERLSALIEDLTTQIEQVTDKQDRAVTDEQLVDSAIRAVRGATETGNREKVRTIAAALVGATSVERPQDLDVESSISALVGLTSADLVAARRLVDHLGPGTFPPPAELGPDALFYMARLQAAGLLETIVLPASDPTARHGPGYRTDPAIEYRFTPTFGRILLLLRAGGVDLA
jgi:hypothetical protein